MSLTQYLIACIESAELQSFVIGLLVPTLFQALKQHFGIEASRRVQFSINVALCAAFSFVPLGLHWAIAGRPDPSTIGSALFAAFAASQARYILLVKGREKTAS
jgi:hypothetical protein